MMTASGCAWVLTIVFYLPSGAPSEPLQLGGFASESDCRAAGWRYGSPPASFEFLFSCASQPPMAVAHK
jgi:hypothetical protein